MTYARCVPTAGEVLLSPNTNLPLLSTALVPNYNCRRLVHWFRQNWFWQSEAAKRSGGPGGGEPMTIISL
jgi:hypothetical protein